MRVSKNKLPGGYGIVQRIVMTNSDFSVPARCLYAILCSMKGGSGICWPSQETLGVMMNLSTRRVREYIHELENAGVLRCRVHTPTSFRRGHEYILYAVDEQKEPSHAEIHGALEAEANVRLEAEADGRFS